MYARYSLYKNLVDVFTKSLTISTFERLVNNIGMKHTLRKQDY